MPTAVYRWTEGTINVSTTRTDSAEAASDAGHEVTAVMV